MRWLLLALALIAGTISDTPVEHPPVMRDGYRRLAVDLHVHAFPLSWSTLAPWDIVLEAKRQGLDAVAIAGHNHVWVGQAGRWFSRLVGGPTVISSEEIHPPSGHVIALGVERTVDWDQSSESMIDEVHRQGGVAIAAHPTRPSWTHWPEAAVRKLDGSEAVQPVTILTADAGPEMREFHKRAGGAAIGSSDYHGLGPIGLCRTYVLARDNSEAAILEAIRAGRTEAVGPEAASNPGILVWVSRVCGVLALLLIVLRPGSRRGSELRQS
jgi:predicted metal-dependent phosphoesterase TrpH